MQSSAQHIFLSCIGVEVRLASYFLSSWPLTVKGNHSFTFSFPKSQRGYKLAAMKLVQPSMERAEEHYHDLSERPFFPVLTKFLSSSPVVAMVWEGKDVVRQGRSIIGATNPLESAPGSIRGDLCIITGKVSLT
jgi:Nucleoside diphosphate kinase